MWCITRRIKKISVDVGEPKYIYYDNEIDMVGIMGLRVGRTKDFLVIYVDRMYKFIPWKVIKDMRIWR